MDVENNFNRFNHDIAHVLTAPNIITRYIQRFAYGTDASFYRLVPKVVLRIESESQLQQVLGLASRYNSRNCEIGLSEQSDISYQSVLYLLDQVSTSKS